MAVNFYFGKQTRLNNRKALKLFIESLFQKEGKELDGISYIFCTDEYLLDINKRFLNHDFYTDIITFDLGSSGVSPIVGEIYISVERVKENASTHNTTMQEELHRVIFHGALHLCGYKDKTKPQQLEMRAKENSYLNIYSRLS